MRVWIRTPFSIEKNLGKAYNEEMAMIPEGDAACFIDGDVMFLTPDYGNLLHEYANKYLHAVLTCWTNRIHEMATGQYYKMDTMNVKDLMKVADKFKYITDATPLNGPVSGFLLLVPKSVWNQHKFTEQNIYRPGQPNLLGCDNEFTNKIRAAGIPILRMDGIIVWHSYRLLTGSKEHLL